MNWLKVLLAVPDISSSRGQRELKQMALVAKSRIILAFILATLSLVSPSQEVMVCAMSYLLAGLAIQWSSSWLSRNYLKHLPIAIDIVAICAYTLIRRDLDHPLENIMTYTAGAAIVVLGASLLLCRPGIILAIILAIGGYAWLFHDFLWNAQVSVGSPLILLLMATAGLYIHRLSLKVADESQRFEKLCRFLSPAVVSEIDRSSHLQQFLKAQSCEITVLFADIRGFTTLSEKWPVEETLETLNEYFSLCTRVIYAHEGTVDKFIGDCVMALFGAPISNSDDALRAMRAAMDIQEEVESWNRKRLARGKEEIRIGIGMNTSVVMAGAVGTPQRLEYTAIGDGVNVASRLCDMTKEVKTPLVFSESTRLGVEPEFKCHPLGTCQIRGRAQEIKIYTLHGQKPYDLPGV